ncbi:MAG: 30S ribosomal protein S6 [Verrucomicrobiales bacterium]|nr:30S ribosomal protein S6 [Verrucomicrobiales bacterium]
MKRYEGLFILNTAGKEEGVKDVIDHIAADIAAAGGKVETIQKMDKRPFARVAERKSSSGFYVNLIFQSEPEALVGLRTKFRLSDDVFRVVFTEAPAVAPKAAAVV